MNDVDIFALPIPDFGLLCPVCDYALVGLPAHRCPECGLTFDMTDLVKPYTVLRPPMITGEELPLPDIGLTCPKCGTDLGGVNRRLCPACDRPFTLSEFRPKRDWVIVFRSGDQVKLNFARIVLQDHLVPTLSGDDEFRLMFGSIGIRGLGPRIEVPRDFYFEARYILRREEARIDAAREDGTLLQERSCPHCGEANPIAFELCWNCEEALSTTDADQAP
jgi:hypothetical protein